MALAFCRRPVAEIASLSPRRGGSVTVRQNFMNRSGSPRETLYRYARVKRSIRHFGTACVPQRTSTSSSACNAFAVSCSAANPILEHIENIHFGWKWSYSGGRRVLPTLFAGNRLNKRHSARAALAQEVRHVPCEALRILDEHEVAAAFIFDQPRLGHLIDDRAKRLDDRLKGLKSSALVT